MTVGVLLRAARLGRGHADGAGLAVDADGPASTTDLVGGTLASGGALRLGELGRADELVATVALATVLGSGNGEALLNAVGNALLVGHGAKVRQDITGQNTANVILVASSVGVSTDSRVALGSNGSGSRGRTGGDCKGLSNGVDGGGTALLVTADGGTASSRQGSSRRVGLTGLGASTSSSLGGRDRLSGVDGVAGSSRLGRACRLGSGSARRTRRGARGSVVSGGGGGAGRTRAHGGSLVTEAEAAEGVVTRQSSEVTSDDLVDQGRNGTFATVQAVGQTRALVHTRVTGVAGVNDVLEDILIPGSHEIGVATEASNITVGEDKRLGALVRGPAAGKGLGVHVGLEEDVRSVNPASRAVGLAIASIGGEGSVGLVVGQASGGVVAGGEVDVKTERRVQAVAVDIGETSSSALVVGINHASLGTVRSGGIGGRVVGGSRAGELDGLDGTLGGVQLRATAASRGDTGHGIARDHLQTRGEGLDVVVGGLEEVVDVGVVDVDRLQQTGLGVVEIQSRVPVVGEVTLDQSGTAVGLEQVLAGGGEAKVAASENVVDVSRGTAGLDNGISTSGDQALVGETKNSESSAVLGSHGSASQGGSARESRELHVGREDEV